MSDHMEGCRIDRVACPVYRHTVTVKATWRDERTSPSLVDFTCNARGMCGIPSWDPCPLYVRYLEGRATGQ